MSVRPVKEFYDSLAPLYDEMTAFDERFEKESPSFRRMVERFSIKNAFDAGCGSGFHSVLLAQLGVAVTAMDVSPEMVKLAKANGNRYGVSLKVQTGSFAEARSLLEDRFDAAFVMGNSLPHLLTREDLLEALENIVGTLRPGGLLVVQCLNYERILQQRLSSQKTRTSREHVFERSYEFEQESVLFSIVMRPKDPQEGKEYRQTVRLRPVLREELRSVLLQLGVEGIEFYGTMGLTPFEPEASTDLITLGRKS